MVRNRSIDNDNNYHDGSSFKLLQLLLMIMMMSGAA